MNWWILLAVILALTVLAVVFRRRAVSLVIRLAYLLRVRKPINDVQRWLVERNAPRAVLPRFLTPEQAWRYLASKFQWRKDKLARWFPLGDWSSHPEVFQASLESAEPTGDCDDYAAWMCRQLQRMNDVEGVLRMSCWTWTKGHTVAVFSRGKKIHVVDYEIVEVDSYEQALDVVRFRHEWGELQGWVFETPELDMVAVWPRVP